MPTPTTLRPPRLRTPLQRAALPVIGGIAVLGLIFLATWGMAVLISRGDAESSERLAPVEFEVGSVERLAEVVAEDGPLIFPDLNTTSGKRTIVVDHTSDDPAQGWRVFWGYPEGRDASCEVELVAGTKTFEDCDGNRLDVSELAPPEGVQPYVLDGERLWIDLRADTTSTTTA